MRKAIIGAGGFGREVFELMYRNGIPKYDIDFFVQREYITSDMQYPLDELDTSTHEVIVAIGEPIARKRIVESLPANTRYMTLISKDCVIPSSVHVGEGSIICEGCVLTVNINIGKHSHLNLLTTIGHDTVTDAYFTTAPGAKISGNNTIGECVYIGTNACTKEKITICDNVTVGLNAGVVSDIIYPGTYIGTPAKRIK